ncbi:hypothetical protein A5724_12530 [Mycobacterium sp. ACS1612]|uniref:hypothetical protein n=1 Tax=Mycobacterium sp. ACS1612 TaxID=1834117 RepID=UPI0007FE10FE|nr:hypothetical protein [Mycobacterium sp. ACS1612]OBF36691.1 hypothetical protein A5724_12530 [Mycobacterium sp. ACS1612]
MGDVGELGVRLSDRVLSRGGLRCSSGNALLITLTSFMRLTNHRAHVLLVSAVTVLLGLLLYLVSVLDHPFGPMGVTGEPFSHAVTVFDLVDQES